MEHKYIVVQSTYRNGDITRIGFGSATVEEYDGVTTILESISDISSDIEPIERLVEVCYNLQLDPIHLQDVVTDFLANVKNFIPNRRNLYLLLGILSILS